MGSPVDGLTITDVARRTGVPSATLRSWEARYGRPSPSRLPGGHRRYTDNDVDFIERVQRLRSGGLELPVAIDRAHAGPPHPEPSLFAGLRRRYPDLIPQVLRKATLLALTRAIEDECCARAERPVLFTLFQTQDFYRQSQDRWNELARTAQLVTIFVGTSTTRADDVVDRAARRDPRNVREPLLVAIPHDAPLIREWSLVCDAPGQTACLAGWERPGQDTTPDAERLFEALWTIDPRVVRASTEICTNLALTFAPHLEPHLSSVALPDEPAAPSADLTRTAGLFTRSLAYLDDSHTHGR